MNNLSKNDFSQISSLSCLINYFSSSLHNIIFLFAQISWWINKLNRPPLTMQLYRNYNDLPRTNDRNEEAKRKKNRKKWLSCCNYETVFLSVITIVPLCKRRHKITPRTFEDIIKVKRVSKRWSRNCCLGPLSTKRETTTVYMLWFSMKERTNGSMISWNNKRVFFPPIPFISMAKSSLDGCISTVINNRDYH